MFSHPFLPPKKKIEQKPPLVETSIDVTKYEYSIFRMYFFKILEGRSQKYYQRSSQQDRALVHLSLGRKKWVYKYSVVCAGNPSVAFVWYSGLHIIFLLSIVSGFIRSFRYNVVIGQPCAMCIQRIL